MQIFEAFELKDEPYMLTKEIVIGNTVREVIEKHDDKAYLIVDHDSKSIFTYYNLKTSFRLQFYCGILAGMMRSQLKLFYRIFPINIYNEDNEKFQEVMNGKLGGGRAQPITEDDFVQSGSLTMGPDLCVHTGLKINQAMENFEELDLPKNYIRKFAIFASSIYTDEEVQDAFVQETKFSKKATKIGQLNNGFTFIGDQNYAVRLFIRDKKVQGIELYISEEDHLKSEPLELKAPIFFEERFETPGDIETLINAFQIPDQLPDDAEDQSQIENNSSE